MKEILILTNSEDGIHSDVICKRLDHLKIKYFRLNVDEVSTGKTKISFQTGSAFEYSIQTANELITSNKVGSIWHRRPYRLNFNIKDPQQKTAAEKELHTFLNGIWLISHGKDIFWLDKPLHVIRAENKVEQLTIASKLGFKIPQTIISNNTQLIKDFYDTYTGGIVFKTLQPTRFKTNTKLFYTATTLVNEQMFQSVLNLTENLPSLFQEYIIKRSDIRVTIVDSRIFAVSIASQEREDSRVDWREVAGVDELSHTVIELPDYVKNFCFQLLKEFGLNFGCFDFAINNEGEYVFFELNPNGQWYWIERKTGLCISEAICDMLIQRLTH